MVKNYLFHLLKITSLIIHFILFFLFLILKCEDILIKINIELGLINHINIKKFKHYFLN